MAIVVEDGTGKETADSYISINTADTYHSNYGNTSWASTSEANKEIALRKATRALDAMFGGRWKGTRVRQDQALDWPRDGVVDRDGWEFDSDEVPAALEDATAIMALRSLTEDVYPDLDNPGRIRSQRNKLAELEEDIEYVGGAAQVTKYRIVEDRVRQLIHSAGHSSLERV